MCDKVVRYPGAFSSVHAYVCSKHIAAADGTHVLFILLWLQEEKGKISTYL